MPTEMKIETTTKFGTPIRLKKRWVEIGGQRFYARSGWEGNFGCYLEFLRSKGQIRSWAHEPTTFWFQGVRRGTVSYKPDFRVIENNGEEVWYEVKGHMDKPSQTKLKRMAKYHPEIKIRVIGRDQYMSLNSKLGRAIPGWVF